MAPCHGMGTAVQAFREVTASNGHTLTTAKHKRYCQERPLRLRGGWASPLRASWRINLFPFSGVGAHSSTERSFHPRAVNQGSYHQSCGKSYFRALHVDRYGGCTETEGVKILLVALRWLRVQLFFPVVIVVLLLLMSN
jgi:hypothetical protein